MGTNTCALPDGSEALLLAALCINNARSVLASPQEVTRTWRFSVSVFGMIVSLQGRGEEIVRSWLWHSATVQESEKPVVALRLYCCLKARSCLYMQASPSQ